MKPGRKTPFGETVVIRVPKILGPWIKANLARLMKLMQKDSRRSERMEER